MSEHSIAYCGTCRIYIEAWPCNPPYAVIHVVDTGKHLHPITRRELD